MAAACSTDTAQIIVIKRTAAMTPNCHQGSGNGVKLLSLPADGHSIRKSSPTADLNQKVDFLKNHNNT